MRSSRNTHLPSGVQIEHFDVASPADHARTITGCDCRFVTRPPYIDSLRRYLLPAVNAALSADVKQFIFVPEDAEGDGSRPHHAVEARLRAVNDPRISLSTKALMPYPSTTHRDARRDRDEIYLPGGHARCAFSGVLERSIACAHPSARVYLECTFRTTARKNYAKVQRLIYRVTRWDLSLFANRKVRKLIGRPARTFRKRAEREKAAWELA